MSLEVVLAVADRKGTDPEGLQPLSDAVDPDALDRLFTAGDGSVRFPYEGYWVTVTAEASIRLEERS